MATSFPLSLVSLPKLTALYRPPPLKTSESPVIGLPAVTSKLLFGVFPFNVQTLCWATSGPMPAKRMRRLRRHSGAVGRRIRISADRCARNQAGPLDSLLFGRVEQVGDPLDIDIERHGGILPVGMRHHVCHNQQIHAADQAPTEGKIRDIPDDCFVLGRESVNIGKPQAIIPLECPVKRPAKKSGAARKNDFLFFRAWMHMADHFYLFPNKTMKAYCIAYTTATTELKIFCTGRGSCFLCSGSANRSCP